MSLVGSSQGCIFKTKPLYVICSLLSFIVMITSFLLVALAETPSFTDSAVLLRVWETVLKFEYLCHIILFLYQIRKRHNLAKFLTHINFADQQVELFKKQ